MLGCDKDIMEVDISNITTAVYKTCSRHHLRLECKSLDLLRGVPSPTNHPSSLQKQRRRVAKTSRPIRP